MKPVIPETHEIQDHTKIKAFMACPRLYFYEYIAGWTQDRDEHDLIYGQAVHLAFEYLYDRQKARGDYHLAERDAQEAWLIFMNYYRQFYPEETDLDKAPKDPANTEKMLNEYVALYSKVDRYEVIYSEISGAVPINAEGRLVYFRLDTVVREPMSGTYMVLEHKTSKWSPHLWEASLKLSLQGGIGVHVLSCLFPPDKVKGLMYNGVFLFKGGNEFHRLPYRRSNEAMLDWLATINHYYSRIEAETQVYLEADTESGDIMHSFPKNNCSCVSYNRPCPFMDFCAAWANPLKDMRDVPPPGFTLKHWDPRDQDKEWHAESAKVVKPEEMHLK